MAAMKVVGKLDLHDDTRKRKAIKAVSALCGIDQIVVDMKDDKMTVVGTVDPIDVIRKLRKRFCRAHMVSVGPAKDEDKDGNRKSASTAVPVHLPCYPPPHHPHPCYFVHTEEDPNACVIC